MKALVTIAEKTAEVKDIDVPRPNEGEILVKVTAVAQNPTDWKAMRAVPPGRIIGCDFCGTVEDANGSDWQKGQRVAGFVQGTATNPERGAFAEYMVIERDLVYAVPDSASDEEAAAIPLAFATAVQALYQRLRLPEVTEPAVTASPVLINGGTSSVGKYAIQLCKLSGLYVIATGSKKNHELLEGLGADACIDYSDEDWPSHVRTLTHGKLEHGFDCISEGGTTKLMGEAMSHAGGHIVTLLPVKQGDIAHAVKVESTIVYTVFNRPLDYGAFDNCGSARPEDKAHWVKYLRLLPKLLTEKKIRANRVKHMDGGLDGIMAGFQLQIDGRVSAEKLCYRIA